MRARLEGATLHAPAHMDAEVLSGLGRLHRAGELPADTVAAQLAAVAAAPIARHELTELLVGAWERRGHLRLADALYVELAVGLGVPLITTDRALGRATDVAEVVNP